MKYNITKITILIFVTLFSLNVKSQHLINQVEPPTKIILKDNGWFTISLSTLILTSGYYIHYKGNNNEVDNKVIVGGLIFTTVIGVGLHVISWKRVHKYNSRPKY